MSVVKNVTKSWRTTLLGVVVIAAAIVSVFVVEGITWFPDASLGVGLGTLLLLSPDRFVTAFYRMLKKYDEE